MPPIASHVLAENLRDANSRLGHWLDRLIPDVASSQPRAITPTQMSGLLSELMRAGASLRALPADREPVLAQQVSQYRRNVERLRDLLPSIHRTLLSERARLERERERIQSATEWARGSRQTF